MLEKMTEIELKISLIHLRFREMQNKMPSGTPFKALLRRWWRVVKAKEVDYDYKSY